MNRIPQTLLLTLALTLIACGGETVYIETPAPDPRPSLSAFHMVDSYDADTGLYHYPELYLNPYRYSGLFELYWYVERRRDYYAEFYVNYRPTINGALFIDEQLCGPGLPCDTYGSQICRYTADFTLSCSPDTAPLDMLAENEWQPRDEASVRVAAHAAAHYLRLLATLGDKRTRWGAPTVKELGVDTVSNSPFGLVGPKGMPRDVVDRLSTELAKVLAQPLERPHR
jgi:hypothetical protein